MHVVSLYGDTRACSGWAVLGVLGTVLASTCVPPLLAPRPLACGEEGLEVGLGDDRHRLLRDEGPLHPGRGVYGYLSLVQEPREELLQRPETVGGLPRLKQVLDKTPRRVPYGEPTSVGIPRSARNAASWSAASV